MDFFNTLHRSITDPKFYREVLEYPLSHILLYLVKLLAMVALITAAAQFYYLFDSKRGIPQQIETLFSGMEIKDGALDPKAPTPIVPPTYKVISLLDQISGYQNYFPSDNDSMVVIDTSKTRSYMLKWPAIVVGKEKLIFIYNKENSLELPYKAIFLGTDNFQFTADNVRQYLKKNWFLISFSMFITAFFQNVITFFFSIFFLSFAAFVFRLEKVGIFSRFLRAASYAITPMALGSMLIAVSGVKIIWGWHILIFISTIVLFRGMVAIGSANSENEAGDNKE